MVASFGVDNTSAQKRGQAEKSNRNKATWHARHGGPPDPAISMVLWYPNGANSWCEPNHFGAECGERDRPAMNPPSDSRPGGSQLPGDRLHHPAAGGDREPCQAAQKQRPGAGTGECSPVALQPDGGESDDHDPATRQLDVRRVIRGQAGGAYQGRDDE